MVRKLLSTLIDKIDQRSNEPRGSFVVTGFENDGRVKIEFNWNDAFIKKIKSLGFEAETDEDSVQLFFFASQMRPQSLAVGDDPVQSENHPSLSGQQNVIVK